jgi:hypothetical protein
MAVAIGLVAAAPVLGCGGAEGLVLVGGERVEAASIDKEPLNLLPNGVLGLASLDAKTLFATGLGGDVSRLVSNVLPIGPESGFVPSRDVERVYAGLYAMQGADYCFVVQGRFDPAAIQRAADARSTSPSGAPLTKTRYAETDLYTVGSVGFVVLTGHTVVSGTETAMRRVLDRLRRDRFERSVPKWMTELLDTKDAAFAFAGDASTGAGEAASRVAPFTAGLRIVRIIGNFRPPGMNFAGTLTYADEASAARGSQAIDGLQQASGLMRLLSAIGFGVSLPSMQLKQEGADVGFAMPVDEGFARLLLGLAVQATGAGATSAGGAWSWL